MYSRPPVRPLYQRSQRSFASSRTTDGLYTAAESHAPGVGSTSGFAARRFHRVTPSGDTAQPIRAVWMSE